MPAFSQSEAGAIYNQRLPIKPKEPEESVRELPLALLPQMDLSFSFVLKRYLYPVISGLAEAEQMKRTLAPSVTV